MARRRHRSSYKDIVDGIFKALNDGEMRTADEVAKLAGCSWQAVINWLDLIMKIQKAPQVNFKRTKRINFYWIPFEQARKRM